MTSRLRWVRGQDPRRKAHAVYVDEYHQPSLCTMGPGPDNSGLGVVKPTQSKRRCKVCIAVARARGLKVR